MLDPLKANFAKITMSENLHVSHILQKSKLEDGTRDSASITGNLITRSLPPWFIVERPFLWFIQHNPTSVVLGSKQTLKSIQKKQCKAKTTLAIKKRLLPYVFHSSVTYLCAVFSF